MNTHKYTFAKSATITIIAVLTVVLAACGGSDANALRNTAWELESLAGNAVLSGTTITIEFSEDQISGSAGCNQYGGSYQAGENSFGLGDLFATEMGCMEPAGILEQETAYLEALSAADTYQIAADRLEMFDKAGAQVLAFAMQ
jgi:heat shock protein HslJ